MSTARHSLQRVECGLRWPPPEAELGPPRSELVWRRHLTVQDQVAGGFERRMSDEVLDGVAAITKTAFDPVDVADPRLACDEALQTTSVALRRWRDRAADHLRPADGSLRSFGPT